VHSIPWPSFFSLPVILLMLITLLNDGTLISIAYDHVEPSSTPEKWNLSLVFLIGSVLGSIACLSSLLLLYCLLNSWNPNGVFQTLYLGGLSYGQITTSIYLKVSISDFLTLFSARAGENWFWESTPPSIVLLISSCIALIISTVIAISLPPMVIDDMEVTGLGQRSPIILPILIWFYCFIFFVIQDAFKVFTYKVLNCFGLFGLTLGLKISDSENSRGGNTTALSATLNHKVKNPNEFEMYHTLLSGNLSMKSEHGKFSDTVRDMDMEMKSSDLNEADVNFELLNIGDESGDEWSDHVVKISHHDVTPVTAVV